MNQIILITSYESYNGGVNNLEVTKVVQGSEILKVCTSLKYGQAKAWAKRWAEHNHFQVK